MLGDVKNLIRGEILAQSAAGQRAPGDDEDLFSAGYLDSLNFLTLLVFINKKLGVSFERSELRFENFKSINTIAERVEKARASGGGS